MAWVGLTGESGCGKSTVLELIQRLYDPDQGCITVDGEDLRNLDLDWWRSQLSFVGQEPALFSMSIRENLELVKPKATDE